MKIGIPREIKNHEYRVGVTPDGAQTLIAAGHTVLVEQTPAQASVLPMPPIAKPARP